MSAGLALLPIKMAIAASVVVGCSLLAERSGPLIAAMIATLPISLGPVLVFLALDHDAAFIADSALGTLNANLSHAGFVLSYVLLAQRRRTFASLVGALAVWVAGLVVVRALALPALPLAALTVVAFVVVHMLVRPYLSARASGPVTISRYALPIRAGCVAALVGIVTVAAERVGPIWSGVLAGLPIVLSSLIVILQPRIGGKATAAMIGSGALGLLGVALGLVVVNLMAVPFGSWVALGSGLAVPVVWNLIVTGFSRRLAP
ncbi:conserved membrane hypothetical protein [Hyphomicrobiales bacterium]|nr:conserved membrane hypothetical protein [Hyphomicrobiales bacterium]CAH1701946.1 conserved membrane hypothetical protein [Hyphomicrobiales bacterium]CAI0346103.1 conserved membrane hypothetical protein [Hyphomicrobiales bacterium]